MQVRVRSSVLLYTESIVIGHMLYPPVVRSGNPQIGQVLLPTLESTDSDTLIRFDCTIQNEINQTIQRVIHNCRNTALKEIKTKSSSINIIG
jgi:hypothetical protein